MNAIKDRQYNDTTAAVTTDLLRSFAVIKAILASKPRRSIHTRLHVQPRMFGASDAAQEPSVGGSGGFLLVTAAKPRLGSVVHIDSSVMTLWPEHDVVIAQLELLMILQALLTFPSTFDPPLAFGSVITLHHSWPWSEDVAIIVALISWHPWFTCFSFIFIVIFGLNGSLAEAIGVTELVVMDSKIVSGESTSLQCTCLLYLHSYGSSISPYCLISFLLVKCIGILKKCFGICSANRILKYPCSMHNLSIRKSLMRFNQCIMDAPSQVRRKKI